MTACIRGLRVLGIGRVRRLHHHQHQEGDRTTDGDDDDDDDDDHDHDEAEKGKTIDRPTAGRPVGRSLGRSACSGSGGSSSSCCLTSNSIKYLREQDTAKVAITKIYGAVCTTNFFTAFATT